MSISSERRLRHRRHSAGGQSMTSVARRRRRSAGQSLVEFTLVFPIMLVVLLTVADFGRFFAAQIAVESAARTAAEKAASEFVVESTRTGGAVDAAGFARIHDLAWKSICAETTNLPGAVPGVGGGECTGVPTAVCVHDGADPDP